MEKVIKDQNDWQQLLQLAEDGDADAQMQVAWHYDNGITVEDNVVVAPDDKLAYEWVKRAYENGNIEAAQPYAHHLSKGIHCPKNTKMAMKLYEEAMKAGDTSAAHNLGTEYRDKQDFKTAFSLYKKDETDFSIAMCYYYGIGVAQNKLKALKLFKKWLKQGDCLTGYDTDEANYLIGRLYLEGEVVKQSINKARHYLQLADAEYDHFSAQHILWIIGRK